ncbi:MAG: insulinase family protein [Bacteroidales bacterium]|nr:insulinase family protein [Bacteroidales bacterium]
MKKIKLTIFILFIGLLSFSQKTNDFGGRLPLDEKVVYGTLPNGMKYYIRHNEVPKNRAEYYIVHNVGAVLENKDQNGLAHFTEHMAFNGTKNFPQKGILNFMELNGVAFGHNVNAFTSHDVTAYMLSKVPTTRSGIIDTSLLVLHDWSSFISMEDEEIDAERGVIREEWRTGRNADRRLRKKTAEVLYSGTKYVEHDVIGRIEVIDNHKYETIKSFYHDWYRPDLQALIIVGDIDPSDIEKRIKKIFADIPKRESPKKRYYIEIPNNKEPLIKVATDPEASRTMVQLIYKHDIVQPKDKNSNYYRSLQTKSLYQIMFNNRLNELTQSEHPPFIYAYNFYGDIVRKKAAYYSLGMAKPNEIHLTLATLLTENKRLKKYGFTKPELERAKAEYLIKTKKQFNERDKTNSGDYVWQYFSHFLNNEPAPGIEYDFEFTKKTLPNIKLEEVNLLAQKWITEDNMVITVTGPEIEGKELFSEQEIKEIIQKIKSRPVEKYEETVSDEPLIKNIPKPTKVISNKTKNGVTEIKYKNGVTVVIKPTDFKDDEILMTAFSFGGYSLVDDNDVPSAIMANNIIPMGGVGEFSNIELNKKLAGKIVRVSPFIDENDEGFTGNSTPADFETMLQLTYLYFTSPRKDKTAYSAFMQRMNAWLENKNLDPNSRFKDTISVTMANNHKRVIPFNKEMLSKVDYEKLFSIYQDRFKDANDFVFIFVGNIDIEKTKPIIDSYIGSLPSSGRIETYKDNNIRYPKGIVKKELNPKLEVDKSTVFVDYSGEYKYTPENNMNLSALKYILSLRYIETIREKEGGSYGVRVSKVSNHFPYGNYQLKMKFDCAPEKSKYLTSIIYREIEKIKKDGPTEADVKKTIEYFKKTREEQLRENNFWKSALLHEYYHGYSLADKANFDKLLGKLNVKSIKKTANNFLNEDNIVQIVMMPKE